MRCQLDRIHRGIACGLNSTYRYLSAEPHRLPDTDWESPGDMGSIDVGGSLVSADRLVAYKCPETYAFVDTPVRDDAGKVRRSMLG